MSRKPKNEPIGRKQPMIYVGPTVTRLGLIRFQIFNEVPMFILRLIDDIPAISRLVVPISELKRVRDAIERLGSAERSWYDSIINARKISGGKNK